MFFKYVPFFCLDTKETKNQGWESSATCYSSIPKSKELAALKQLLILRNLRNAGAHLPDSKAKPTKNYYQKGVTYNYITQVIDF